MVLAITAEVVGTHDPQTVQVVASGLVVGEEYEIRGSWAGGQWFVRGGVGVAEDTQVILGDAATPVNTVITYAVVTPSGAAASAPITVDYDGQYVLQSLDAALSASFVWRDNRDPRSMRMRTAVYDVPGRSRPVVHYDIPAGESGQMLARTSGEQTPAMRTLLSTGAPLVIRTDGHLRDLAAVEYVAVVSVSHGLTGANPGAYIDGAGNDRVWDLGFELIDDPEPDTVVSTSTWTDFDGAYEDLSWDTFDTEWSGLTWDDFDVEDWATRVSVVNPTFGFGFGPFGTYPFGL